MNLFKSALLQGFILFCGFLNAQDTLVQDTLHIKGVYQGKNLFVKNNFNENENGFCVKMVYLNDKMIITKTNQSAFEIKLSNYSINEGDEVDIKIAYVGVIQPSILNLEDIGSSNKPK
jgi:hypothetical protein